MAPSRFSQISATVAAGVAVLIAGCDALHALSHGVIHPMTPDQSKAQVVDATREIVASLDLHGAQAFFWRASCNDDGVAPFRGEVAIRYPPAPSFEQSDAEIARMVQHLQTLGWSGDPGFHTHGAALTKHDVVAVFGPQNVSTPNRSIDILGECRDVTTTKATKGSAQPVTLS
ncbi:hypothetical protein [Mycobacterium sp. Marseille-P9652]|uniref:hypothetical protein n=1 Tax=Mycobacterium sp. Marseille-P9652 TaxID=2654950 RepID=UPI001E3953CC|nr:hypothetical protein [Mycobacterium sp. Marseille-P9652]